MKIDEFAVELNKNLPRSEKWFQSFWKEQRLEDPQDEYNRPFGNTIPDVVNHKYRYVIEVDGSWHKKRSQKKIDKKKNRFYEFREYEILRLKAFDEKSLNHLVECVERIRTRYTRYFRPQIILRKIDPR